MTVKELIEKLEEFPQDDKVVIWNSGYMGEIEEADEVHQRKSMLCPRSDPRSEQNVVYIGVV